MIKKLFFIGMTIIVAAVIFIIYTGRTQTPLDSSYSQLFQTLGLSTEIFTGILLKSVPADRTDEKKYGEAIKARFDASSTDDEDLKRIRRIMAHLSTYGKKNFTYKIYIYEDPYPNACAFPGGAIVMTRALIANSKTDGEIAAVIAHEMGHIELSHCFDRVKLEVAAKKVRMETLGALADMSIHLMMGYSYSKTQESEADEYAWALLVESEYDPSSLGKALKNLRDFYGDRDVEMKGNVIRDYYSSHPPLKIRIEKYEERGRIWHKKHPREKRIG